MFYHSLQQLPIVSQLVAANCNVVNSAGWRRVVHSSAGANVPWYFFMMMYSNIEMVFMGRALEINIAEKGPYKKKIQES